MRHDVASTAARAAGIILGILAAAASASLGEEPIPRWGGGTTSNMASAARNLPSDLDGVRPLWDLRLGSHQYTIPTVDRGRIYLGTDDVGLERPGLKPTGGGVLSCVDQATGKLIWRFWSPRYVEGVIDPHHFDQWRCGICSGPVVDGDRVYVVGNRGEVLCLDREGQANGNDGPFLDELAYMGVRDADLGPGDGDLIWRYDMLIELGVIGHDVCGSTILVLGDLLYVATSNGIDGRHREVPRPDVPSLIVLDKRTGRLVAADGERIGRRMLHAGWSSPCAGSSGGRMRVFLGGADGVLYAFEPADPKSAGVQTLRRLWARDANAPEYRERDGKPLPYSRHDRPTPDGPSEIIGSPVFHEGRVWVTIGQSPLHGAGRGRLTCVDAATGDEVWASSLVDRSLATPSLAGGLAFVSDTSGNLHCFDAATGERLWAHELGAGAWCASTFVADGKVYASAESNELWVLAASREKKVLSSLDLESMPITPTAVDGVLYLPTQKRLRAYPGGDAAAGSR